MAATKYGAAYQAASLVSRRRVTEIAKDYVDWIDAKADENLAIDSLLGAMNHSKSPARVLVRADALYTEIATVDAGDNPTITLIDPATGAAAGGDAVTITGTNLTGTSSITFGGAAATSVVVVSDTSVTCVTPAHAAGAVDVVLTAYAGSVTETGGFTYA